MAKNEKEVTKMRKNIRIWDSNVKLKLTDKAGNFRINMNQLIFSHQGL